MNRYVRVESSCSIPTVLTRTPTSRTPAKAPHIPKLYSGRIFPVIITQGNRVKPANSSSAAQKLSITAVRIIALCHRRANLHAELSLGRSQPADLRVDTRFDGDSQVSGLRSFALLRGE